MLETTAKLIWGSLMRAQIPGLNRFLAIPFVAALSGLVIIATPASAGTFDIKTPDSTKGQLDVSVNTTTFAGFPINSELLRFSAEAGVAYGVRDWWTAGVKFNLDKPFGESLQFSTAGIEHLFVLRKLNAGFGLGFYAGVDAAIDRDATNSTTFGPVIQFGTDKTSLTLNPFLSKTFGQNREDGIALNYGWQAKHELREGLAFGIEGYGVISNLGNSQGLDFQEHRIGPVLYFERELGSSKNGGSATKLSMKDTKGATGGGMADAATPKLAFEVGVLFGLTQGTQDTAIKVKGGISF
jgi:hypothetical protein